MYLAQVIGFSWLRILSFISGFMSIIERRLLELMMSRFLGSSNSSVTGTGEYRTDGTGLSEYWVSDSKKFGILIERGKSAFQLFPNFLYHIIRPQFYEGKYNRFIELTIRSLSEDARQSLKTCLSLHVPDSKCFIHTETDELTSTAVQYNMCDWRHMSS